MKTVFFLATLFLGAVSMYAQDIEVKKFELLEKDQTAALSPRKDINGADCALVLVESLKKGIEFEGWVVGDVEYKEDCYWVYMANGSKHLKLKHPNYQTKDIVFGEYGINSLKSGESYLLNIADDVYDLVNKVYNQGWNLNKVDVPNNVKSFIRMAATRGDTKAQVAMAQLSLDGHVNMQDGQVNHRGIIWIKKLLAAGDSTCLEDMPGELMYAYALQLIDDAYHSGDISSDRSLDCVDTIREKKVYTKVCEFEIKACLKGFSQAGNDLFEDYLKSNGLPQYSNVIIRCCEDSSKVGNTKAMVCLGNIYENGIGCKVDLLEAEKWYHQLYEKDSSQCDALCRIYGNKSYSISEEQMSFIRNLSNGGNEEALFQLGCMYEEGRNVQRDMNKAFDLFNRCTLFNDGYHHSHEGAVIHLARILYDRGEYNKAGRLLLDGIRTPNMDATYLRGIMMYQNYEGKEWYMRGSKDEALSLLNSIAKQGHKEAKEFIKQINN